MTRRPRLLIAAVTMFALLLGQAHGAGAAPAPAKPAMEARFSSVAEYCADSEEFAFLKLINDYRAQNNLPALAFSQTLGAASDHHSIDMATNNYFTHNLFDGTGFATNMENHGYTKSGGAVGENIAAGPSTASGVFSAWKASSGHNANMLSPYFKAIGIGRAYNANSTYKWYWTTDFGGYFDVLGVVCSGAPAPTATATAPQPTPTKTPTPTAVPPTATNTPAPSATATNTPQPPTKTPQPTSTPTNVPTVAPTATSAPAGVYVSALTGKASTRRGSTTIAITATVKDTTGLAVKNANVSVVIGAPDGSSQSLSGTTNSRGQVSWSVDATAGPGTYIASVSVVSAGGRTYDPGLNAQSSVTIVVR